MNEEKYDWIPILILLLVVLAEASLLVFSAIEDNRVRLECAAAGYERYESRALGPDYCIKVLVEEQTNTVRLDGAQGGRRE